MVYFDRVLETSTTTGTGSYTLAGAQTGYQSFSVVGNGNLATYSAWAVDAGGNPTGVWEVGVGTWATGGVLARTTFLTSSTGSPISWAAGTKWIALTIAAAKLGTMAEQNANAVAITGGTGVFSSLRLDGFNDLTLLPSATGEPVSITASGGDADIPIYLTAKGSGPVFCGPPASGLATILKELIDSTSFSNFGTPGKIGEVLSYSPDSAGDHGYGGLVAIGSRGTLAAPLKNQDGDVFANFSGYYFYANPGDVPQPFIESTRIYSVVNGTPSLTSSPSYLYIATTRPGTLDEENDLKIGWWSSATDAYRLWIPELTGPTNAYAFWYDGRSVVRIKDDPTLGSVLAIYNRTFTKYVAGATDYERIAMQFNSDVAEIGAEAGGTGTLRALRLLGSGLTFKTASTTLTFPAVTDTVAALGQPQTWTGVQQFGTIGGAVSKLAIAGSTSGKAILDAPAVAGTAVITLPGVTSTLATLLANSYAGTQTIASGNLNFVGAASTDVLLKKGASTELWARVGDDSNYGFFRCAGFGLYSGTNEVVDLNFGASGMTFRSVDTIGWAASATTVIGGKDAMFSRGGAAATIQQGAANAASPVAQRLQAQGSRSGTDSNVGGADYTLSPGPGTGTGTASSLIVKAPAVVASGTGAQTDTEIFRANTTSGLKMASGQPIQLGNAAVTGLAAGVLAATTNATVTITDSAGQVYRVPCII